MRDTVTISFPADLLKELKAAAKKAGFSLSEFVQKMFRLQKNFISEEELLEDIRQGEEDYARGETLPLNTDEDIERFFHDTQR